MSDPLPPWTESILDSVLRRLSPDFSRHVFRLAKRRAAELVTQPWTQLVARSHNENTLLVEPSRRYVPVGHHLTLTPRQEKALVECCAVSCQVYPVRIGDRALRVDRSTRRPKKRSIILTRADLDRIRR